MLEPDGYWVTKLKTTGMQWRLICDMASDGWGFEVERGPARSGGWLISPVIGIGCAMQSRQKCHCQQSVTIGFQWMNTRQDRWRWQLE